MKKIRNTMLSRHSSLVRNSRDTVHSKSLDVSAGTLKSPAQLLSQRLQDWKQVIKEFINYFHQVAQLNQSVASDFSRISQSFQLSSQHSLLEPGQNGIQDVLQNLRTQNDKIAAFHNTRSNSIRTQAIEALENLRVEIKQRRFSIEGRLNPFIHRLQKAREEIREKVIEFDKATDYAHGESHGLEKDPYLIHHEIKVLVDKQLSDETEYRKAALHEQDEYIRFEKRFIERLKSIVETYFSWFHNDTNSLLHYIEQQQNFSSQIPVDNEWDAYEKRNETVLVKKGQLKPLGDEYSDALRENHFIHPKRTGTLDYRHNTQTLSNWARSHFVLSEAGFLHIFHRDMKEKDMSTHTEPPFASLSLKHCYLTSDINQEDNYYWLDIFEKTSGTKFMKKSHDRVHSLRSSSYNEVMAWRSDLAPKCRSAPPLSSVSRPFSTSSEREAPYASPPESPGLEKHHETGGKFHEKKKSTEGSSLRESSDHSHQPSEEEKPRDLPPQPPRSSVESHDSEKQYETPQEEKLQDSPHPHPHSYSDQDHEAPIITSKKHHESSIPIYDGH